MRNPPTKTPGYTATDDVDGDITESVRYLLQIDTDTLGEYEISYIVRDQAGKPHLYHPHRSTCRSARARDYPDGREPGYD